MEMMKESVISIDLHWDVEDSWDIIDEDNEKYGTKMRSLRHSTVNRIAI